jgi:hypothetical protein
MYPVSKNVYGGFRANGDFRQWSLNIFGNVEVSREADNLGTAKLFEAVSARAGRLSSAAAENVKEHCRANKFQKS